MLIETMANGDILVKVDKSLYHHDSILKAAYKFTNNCYVQTATIDAEHYGIYLSAKTVGFDILHEANEFYNELIDQELRFTLEENNRSIKEIIMQKAFPILQNE